MVEQGSDCYPKNMFTPAQVIGLIVDAKKKIVRPDSIGQGLGYKSLKNWKSRQGICYIPENSLCGYIGDGCYHYSEAFTYKDFLDAARESARGFNPNVNDAVAKDIADFLFESIDWQYPSTLICDFESSIRAMAEQSDGGKASMQDRKEK